MIFGQFINFSLAPIYNWVFYEENNFIVQLLSEKLDVIQEDFIRFMHFIYSLSFYKKVLFFPKKYRLIFVSTTFFSVATSVL